MNTKIATKLRSEDFIHNTFPIDIKELSG